MNSTPEMPEQPPHGPQRAPEFGESPPGKSPPGEFSSFNETPPHEESKKAPGHRRNGNVARLPLATRLKINHLLQDGATYREILEELGDELEGIDISNLNRWKEGGYQDWLVEQTFINRIRARQETPIEMVSDFDATEVNHAALQVGTLLMFEALRDLTPGSLNQKLGGDAPAFFRLINALSRASRETTLLQQYRGACQKAREGLHKIMDPNRKLTEAETLAIVRKVDEILGFT